MFNSRIFFFCLIPTIQVCRNMKATQKQQTTVSACSFDSHTHRHNTYACTYRAHGNESANLISVCDDITPLHTQRERWRTALHRRSDNLCYEMIEHEIRSHTHQHTCTQTMCTVRKRVVWMCLCVAPVPTSQNQTKNHAFTSMLLGVYLCFSVLVLSVLCVCVQMQSLRFI